MPHTKPINWMILMMVMQTIVMFMIMKIHPLSESKKNKKKMIKSMKKNIKW